MLVVVIFVLFSLFFVCYTRQRALWSMDSSERQRILIGFLELCTLTKQLMAARLFLSPFSPLTDRICRIVVLWFMLGLARSVSCGCGCRWAGGTSGAT